MTSQRTPLGLIGRTVVYWAAVLTLTRPYTISPNKNSVLVLWYFPEEGAS